MPDLVNIFVSLDNYRKRIALRNDYTLHTTPLSVEVVDDLCKKLEIMQTSENCKPGVTVYSPELFDDIKNFFYRLPDQDATHEAVDEVLGPYLILCGKPSSANGSYRCKYDIRGDGVYRIYFYFDSDGRLYKIGDNRGGS